MSECCASTAAWAPDPGRLGPPNGRCRHDHHRAAGRDEGDRRGALPLPSGRVGAGSSGPSTITATSCSAGRQRSSAIAGRRRSRSAKRRPCLRGARQGHRAGAPDPLRLSPQYIADAWIAETKRFGMTITPSYVVEPECNGVIERFMRT